MLRWDIENEYFERGVSLVCGVDEAGRGPLAGPLVAAACILPAGLVIDGLNDSKKLSEKRREALFDIIRSEAVAYAVAMASVAEIDAMNILNADMLAMKRAVEALSPAPEVALIDGNIVRGFELEVRTVVKGDSISPSIAAASILAKVTRDRYCLEMDKLHPEYSFAAHKGYPTAYHMEMVRKYGPCELHRRTFLGFLSKPEAGK